MTLLRLLGFAITLEYLVRNIDETFPIKQNISICEYEFKSFLFI